MFPQVIRNVYVIEGSNVFDYANPFPTHNRSTYKKINKQKNKVYTYRKADKQA